jgi:1,4-alpha-glucan branching enzyme
LHIEEEEIIEIPIDNQVAITISHDLVVHGKTKHLNMKLYFLWEV